MAAVKILSVRRKAAQKFWAPQQDHRPLRNRIMGCVGEGLCPARGRPQGSPLRKRYKGCGEESPSHGFAVPAPFRQGGRGDGGCGCPCCGAQNFCAALRRTLKILTAATRSPRFFCHRQRSVRSPHRPAVPATKLSVGAGFSCPPLCQPTDSHCRGRQSEHFLEIASLHPPLAALRRFPRPVLTGKPCPARPPHTAVLRFSPARGRCSTITAQSSPSPLRHRDSSNISAASSRASVPVKPASRFSSHSSQL